MTKKIIFRADGNSQTGLGHLYRLFSLVEIIKDEYSFVFLTKEESTINIIPKDYNLHTIPKNITIKQEPNWIQSQFSPESFMIIADGYCFNSNYQQSLKEKGFDLIYIDDLAIEHMYADVVINHAPFSSTFNYKKQPYTRLALGTKYALLRPNFLKAAQLERVIEKIDTVFICFGGADPYNLTLKALKAVLAGNYFKHIHIVLGGAYKHEEYLEFAKKCQNKLTTHRNLSESQLIDIMKNSQFAIAPASTILYELCCVKMPILSGFYVDNQKQIYKGLLNKKVIFGGGDFSHYSVIDFQKKIEETLNSDIELQISNQHKLFNGNSKKQLLQIINSMSISFRKANQSDLLRTFNWSNDTLVRHNSYNTKPIKLEDHKKWFSTKIKQDNTLFLIALVDNKPAGVVRYEIEKNKSIVGVLVSKEYRGQKLATEFLKKSAEYYFKIYDLPIIAYIKKENKASIKAFEKARYMYFKQEIIQGSISFAYKLEKPNV